MHLCFSNEVFTVTHRKTRRTKSVHTKFRSSHPAECTVQIPINPKTVFNHSSYPKLEFMKAISTFTSLFLIIITCATSAVLYLNENYTISAVLTIVWIVALTLWIGKCMGFVDLFINKTFAKH